MIDVILWVVLLLPSMENFAYVNCGVVCIYLSSTTIYVPCQLLLGKLRGRKRGGSHTIWSLPKPIKYANASNPPLRSSVAGCLPESSILTERLGVGTAFNCRYVSLAASVKTAGRPLRQSVLKGRRERNNRHGSRKAGKITHAPCVSATASLNGLTIQICYLQSFYCVLCLFHIIFHLFSILLLVLPYPVFYPVSYFSSLHIFRFYSSPAMWKTGRRQRK